MKLSQEPIIDGMCKGSLSIGTGCKRCGKCAVEMQSIITSLEQDNQEQCRLNAMGAEREARLMARVKELEYDNEHLRAVLAEELSERSKD